MANQPDVPSVSGPNGGQQISGNRGSERTKDEVALELMKFIAVTTGYGKNVAASTGFSGKPSKSADEYAEALIQLFERCRAILAK